METTLIKFLNDNNSKIHDRWTYLLRQTITELFSSKIQHEITKSMLVRLHVVMQGFLHKHQNRVQLATELVSINKKTTLMMSLVEIYEASTYDILQQDTLLTPKDKEYLQQQIKQAKTDVLFSYIQMMEDKHLATIHNQRKALQELSTPIMPVFDRIIIVPIIGTIDSERSKQMMENVLNGVIVYKAEIILLDITGVPFVDSNVAQHIVHMIRAIHIVGGQCILVGFSPEIAQTFVTLGVDLKNIRTLGTLQEGVEKSLEQTNRRISEVL
ncbi:STAS domain-containing protein [Kurthia sibirica]|uniref:STAS domain-containing protein n=1 Tax=Kurthia sibirica TaxID=202750 RepID=A0A2U3AK25_9BACL|nr:STAS domain-containing protein [Kurthia sibirica]PWI24890.1 hypothetical protein DEX24_10765 [Kurthia sibirica]GEK33205.1 RsbT co-antagonist protein RsbRA [Kurthia sibirica]